MKIKRWILSLSVVSLFGLTGAAVAQQQPTEVEQSRTKLEAFQAQSGAVIIKGYSEIGRVAALGFVTVTAMEFTDATSGRREAGVAIDIKEGGRLETKDRSFIDYDEIEALIKGIDYISRATNSVTKLEMFEAIYKTKGNFSAVAFNSSRSAKIETAVKTGHVRPATAYLSLEQLSELRALVVQAKMKLDGAR